MGDISGRVEVDDFLYIIAVNISCIYVFVRNFMLLVQRTVGQLNPKLSLYELKPNPKLFHGDDQN